MMSPSMAQPGLGWSVVVRAFALSEASRFPAMYSQRFVHPAIPPPPHSSCVVVLCWFRFIFSVCACVCFFAWRSQAWTATLLGYEALVWNWKSDVGSASDMAPITWIRFNWLPDRLVYVTWICLQTRYLDCTPLRACSSGYRAIMGRGIAVTDG